MSTQTLQALISKKAEELLPSKLVTSGLAAHKKQWRDCPCSWCEKKREATIVIGSHVPRTYKGFYVEDARDAWRDEKRREYRKALAELERE